MSGQPDGGGARTCPYCNYPVPPGSPPLCLNCLRPLQNGDEDTEPMVKNAVTPSGVETPSATDDQDPPPVSDPSPAERSPKPPEAVMVCSGCGFENAKTRARCERCARELVTPPPTVPPPNVLAPAVAPKRRWVPVVTVLAVAVLVFGATYWLTRPDIPMLVAPVSDSPTPSVKPVLVPVARKDITATASSTLDEGDRYSIDNTLDGKRGTAWNSNGSEVGPQAKGVKLTYQFDRPQDLRRIDIYNGYQKSDDVFTWNGRLRQVTVTGDDGMRHPLKLKDKQGRQKFTVDVGVTSSIVIEVEKVWRQGTRLDDLAVSDVMFYVVQ